MAKIKGLPNDWRNIILDTMREGGSERKAIIALGIPRKKHAEIDDEEYAETFREGHHLNIAYWEDLYHQGATGKVKTNNTMMIFKMKQLGWSDKQETKVHTSKLFERHKVEETISQYKLKEKKDEKTMGDTNIN